MSGTGSRSKVPWRCNRYCRCSSVRACTCSESYTRQYAFHLTGEGLTCGLTPRYSTFCVSPASFAILSDTQKGSVLVSEKRKRARADWAFNIPRSDPLLRTIPRVPGVPRIQRPGCRTLPALAAPLRCHTQLQAGSAACRSYTCFGFRARTGSQGSASICQVKPVSAGAIICRGGPPGRQRGPHMEPWARWRHHEFPIEGRDWMHNRRMGPRNRRLAGCTARAATLYHQSHPAVNIGNQVGFVSIANP